MGGQDLLQPHPAGLLRFSQNRLDHVTHQVKVTYADVSRMVGWSDSVIWCNINKIKFKLF